MHNHNDETATTAVHPGGNTSAQPSDTTREGAGCVAGVDIGGTNLRVALANMAGTVVARWSSSTTGVRGPDAVIRMLCDGLRETLDGSGIPRDSLKAVAAGVPGVTDVERGIVLATSYLMGWRDVSLRARLEDELRVPAAVDNDVNLAAIGESWVGAAKDARDFVFLAIGTGIGAGIILDGRPYRGSQWAAGEIGYMLLPGTIDGPGKAGEPGALEQMIGGEGIKAEWLRLWSANETTLPRELRATEILDYALDGDLLAQRIRARSATMLAQAIYNVSLVLNCSLFVLGGGVGTHPALRDATQSVLDAWAVRGRPRVIVSALGADAQLFGAVRSALDVEMALRQRPVIRQVQAAG